MHRKIAMSLVFGCYALAAPAFAQEILLLNEQCNASTAYFAQALTDAGLTFTEVNSTGAFEAALVSGTNYDVVIIDEYNQALSELSQSALVDLVQNRNGCSFINYWAWFSALAEFDDAFGVTFVSDYSTPVPIYPWDAASPLYTTPNTIATLTPSADTCDRDGARFGTTTGTAIGGYFVMPNANEAGFVVGNSGRTVLFGGISGLLNGDADIDTIPDGAELAENVVTYLEAQGCLAANRGFVDVPALSPLGTGVLAVALAVFAIVAVRRRSSQA